MHTDKSTYCTHTDVPDSDSGSINTFLIINVACNLSSEYGTTENSSILNPNVSSFSIAYTNSDIDKYSPIAVNDILYTTKMICQLLYLTQKHFIKVFESYI